MVESEEPPQQNGHSGEGDEFYIEPEPVRAALLTEELMDILTGYTPGTLGKKLKSVFGYLLPGLPCHLRYPNASKNGCDI